MYFVSAMIAQDPQVFFKIRFLIPFALRYEDKLSKIKEKVGMMDELKKMEALMMKRISDGEQPEQFQEGLIPQKEVKFEKLNFPSIE